MIGMARAKKLKNFTVLNKALLLLIKFTKYLMPLNFYLISSSICSSPEHVLLLL